MKNSSQHLIAEVPRRRSTVEMTIGVDLGDVWSYYYTLNHDGEVVDRGRFTTTPKAIAKWFTDLPSTRVAMEAGIHSILSSVMTPARATIPTVWRPRILRILSFPEIPSPLPSWRKVF